MSLSGNPTLGMSTRGDLRLLSWESDPSQARKPLILLKQTRHPNFQIVKQTCVNWIFIIFFFFLNLSPSPSRTKRLCLPSERVNKSLRFYFQTSTLSWKLWWEVYLSAWSKKADGYEQRQEWVSFSLSLLFTELIPYHTVGVSPTYSIRDGGAAQRLHPAQWWTTNGRTKREPMWNINFQIISTLIAKYTTPSGTNLFTCSEWQRNFMKPFAALFGVQTTP